jgi:glycosyltransferase involved in cell wall biosynthesis
MKKKRCRILYIQKTPAGGSVISLYELLRGLDMDTFEPIVLFHSSNFYHKQFEEIGAKVFTLFDKPVEIQTQKSRRDIEKTLRDISVLVSEGYRNAKQVYKIAFKDLTRSQRIAEFIKSKAVDLVHHNYALPNNHDGVLAARMANVRQICHIRKFDKLSFIDKFMTRYVNYFIYISKAVQETYHHQGISPNMGKVIYNPFEINSFLEKSKNYQLFEDLGLTEKDRIITNVGRLDWWKGHDYFLKAIAEVVKTEPNIKVLIVGSANDSILCQDYYQSIQDLVYKLKLSNYVKFTGYRKDIPNILSGSDILVHSASEPEPFGRVVVEGMLAGLPVIATAAGGVLEIIEDKKTGILIPPKNINAMKNAIKLLLNNQKLAKKIGSFAKKTAIKRFSHDKHAKAIEITYNRILKDNQIGWNKIVHSNEKFNN